MIRRFRDRTEAGRLLARLLTRYAGRADVLILALPRGGVPVASRWPRRFRHRWMSWWYRNWACPTRRNWPWAQSPRVGYAY